MSSVFWCGSESPGHTQVTGARAGAGSAQKGGERHARGQQRAPMMRSAAGLARSHARARTRRLVGSHHNDRNRGPHSSKDMSSQTSVGSQRWLLEASGVGSAATREDPGPTHQPCRCKSPSWGFLPHPQTANHTSGLLFALTSHHVAPSHPFAFAPGWLRRPRRAGLGRQAWRVSREHLAVREEMHQPLFTLGNHARTNIVCTWK